jgi:hypothetical protein
MRIGLAAALLVACNGNSEGSFSDLYPVFASAPDRVDFGEVGPPASGTAVLTLTNEGAKRMNVTGAITEGTEFFTLDEPLDVEIAPDELVTVTLGFTPETFRKYEGVLTLETTDEERATVRVPLVGLGVDLPLPDIAIAPGQTIELPEVPPSSVDYFTFNVVNEGDAPLVITEYVLEGGPEFRAASLFTPSVVAPGDFATAIVEYAPNGAVGSTATVTVKSDDPDEPEVPVLLVGNGGGDFQFPEAIIDCPANVLLAGPETVRLSALGSSDPAGFEPLSYQWTVTQRPAASDADIPLDPDDQREADLRVDVAGTWSVTLIVKNSIGTASAPAVCTFEALPEDNLHIELSWDTTAADLDLHLNLAGAAIFDVPSVCNWCNKNEDWGVSGNDDDPRLDIDDRGGLGPENVNILEPADGGYDVLVHDFAANGDGISTATVKIWLAGVVVFEDSQALEQGDLWRVGQVSWSTSPTFLVDDTVGPVGVRTECF